MSMKLYIARLPLEVEPSTLVELLEQYGSVTHIERLFNQRTETLREMMTAEMDPASAMSAVEALNGYQLLEDEPLFVTPYHPGEPLIADGEELKQYVSEVARQLQERESIPRRQLRAMAKFCGKPFVQAMLRYTLQVQQQGGLKTSDDSRERTLGGVFFYLARQRMSNKMQKMVFFIPSVEEEKAKKSGGHGNAQKRPPRGNAAPQRGGDRRPNKPQTARHILFNNNSSQPASAPPPPEEILPMELTPEIREEFVQLQGSLKTAQSELESLRRSGQDKSSLFTATKEVWRIESRLKTLQKQFPELVGV